VAKDGHTPFLKGVHMAVSRRKFLTSVVAASALAAVSATELVAAASAAQAASPPGDVVGKITVGY
jgi:secreted PhoX family phosphatase